MYNKTGNMKMDNIDVKPVSSEREEPFAESLSQMILTIGVVIIVLIVIGLFFYLVLEQH
jgi:heme/copper-type cytochrome/quinol oxidase subunit 2